MDGKPRPLGDSLRVQTDGSSTEQLAAKDKRPIGSEAVDAEIQRQTAQLGGRLPGDPAMLRRATEWRLRVVRTQTEMVAGAAQPTGEDARAFFEANRNQFQRPEMFEASHIVGQECSRV